MKKRRVKRYQFGGETEAVPTPEIEERRREIGDYIRQGERTPMADAESEKTFKQAFAAARKSGDRTFTYGGKRYTTEMAGEKAKRSSKYDDVVKGSELGSQDFAAKKAPEKTRDTSSAALLAIPAAAAAAAGMRRNIKTGSRAGSRVEPTMSRVRTQEIDPFDQMAMDRMTGEGGRKKGGYIKAKKMASGGSASSRADGIAQRGKTKGRIC